jgi:hypothetical protein
VPKFLTAIAPQPHPRCTPAATRICDELTDFFDIDSFLLALFAPTDYAAAFCNGSVCAVDTSCDGLVDFAAIDPLLQRLF